MIKIHHTAGIMWKRFVLGLSILWFSLISYVVFNLSIHFARGYEISIYQSTPVIFWASILLGLFVGIFILILYSYGKIDGLYRLGFIEIIFCNILLISLYGIRGYSAYLGRGDQLTYIGMARDILSSGTIFPKYDFYPIIPILISQMSMFSGISVPNISKYLQCIFILIYLLSGYIFAKSLFNNDNKVIAFFLISSTPLFYAIFSPSIYFMYLSILMIPLFFYLILKNANPGHKILCIIFCFFFTFVHPLTSIFVFIYTLIIFISDRLGLNNGLKVSFNLLFIFFISIALWFTEQYLLIKSIKTVISELIGHATAPTTAALASSYINKLGVIKSLQSSFLMQFDEIIFYSLAFISIIYILSSKKEDLGNLKSLCYCFIIGTIFLIFIFFSAQVHNPDRLINMNFNMILAPSLVGYLIYRFTTAGDKVKSVVVIFLILSSIITSILSIYPSPITVRPNDQVSPIEINGMRWLIDKKDINLKTADIITPVTRYADFLYGTKFVTNNRLDLFRDFSFPDHFGYNDSNNKYISIPIDKSRYFIVTPFDIGAYAELWENVDRFTKKDFARLNLFGNINKIYDSGIQIYIIFKNKEY